jgi:hypothetical protein
MTPVVVDVEDPPHSSRLVPTPTLRPQVHLLDVRPLLSSLVKLYGRP